VRAAVAIPGVRLTADSGSTAQLFRSQVLPKSFYSHIELLLLRRGFLCTEAV
jgi:hypothetical protein